ncbi:MAG: NAD(P)/FAD-dependent oxidoreductase, partial [Candidatus Altiarchaeota archaeon]|nr:NAD(P)/FAD-dependent oxidoreductase [Candidatus Altiarchaeota archaeon]
MDGYDVVVIGAGPAGSTASAILAESGINTLLIDKKTLPRQKTCGGAVSKKALSVLDAAGIDVPKLKTFKKCSSIQVGVFDSDSVENLVDIKVNNEVAYLIDRDEFDYALTQDAVSKGAELKQKSAIKDIEKENTGFIIKGAGFSIKSRYVLCADGVCGTSAELLGFRDRWSSENVGLCIESEITGYNPPPSPINFYFGGGGVGWGYAWFFDKSGRASVGVGTVLKDASNLRQLFNSFIKNCSGINPDRNLEIGAWMVPGTGGIKKDLSNGNALLLGDAAGLVDPFLGEGISYAIQSGKIAAECIINNEIRDYNKRVGEEITNNLRYARFLVEIAKINPKRFIKLFSDDEEIWRSYVGLALGDSTYKQFLKNI